MTRSRIRGALLAMALAAAAPTALGAQVETAKPIRIQAPKPRVVKFRGEVVSATPVEITVRSRENERIIHTFRYSPKVRDAMQKIIDRGGYQYGDRVEVRHEAGSDVAIGIKGKPSKPR